MTSPARICLAVPRAAPAGVLALWFGAAAAFIGLIDSSSPKPHPQASIPLLAGHQSSKQSGLATKSAQSISGRLTGDGGNPIPNCEVDIYAVAGRGLWRTTTDADGRFTARDLAPGAYTVRPYAIGYVDQSDEGATTFYRPGDFAAINLVKGGVITGRVTDAMGEPVVHASVRATRIGDLEGHTIRELRTDFRERATEDRGIYRIFGLRPGSYVVCVAGFGGISQGIVYTDSTPTYFPSSTRGDADQISVRAGQVIEGVDILYRPEIGHIVSGSVSSANAQVSVSSVTLSLIDSTSGSITARAYLRSLAQSGSFAFHGIPDGDYFVMAEGWPTANGPLFESPLYRITVKGGDVDGLVVALKPLSTLSGRVVVEPLKADGKPSCPRLPETFLLETVLVVRKDSWLDRNQSVPFLRSSTDSTAPSKTGEFKVNNLRPGTYHIDVRPPVRGWYVKSVTKNSEAINALTTSSKGSSRPKPRSSAIELKTGENVSDVTIVVAQGGAELRGQAEPSEKGATLPSPLQVHLVPDDSESAENPLRFFQSSIGADGTFRIGDIAPGRYRAIIVTALSGTEPHSLGRPLAWDEAGRKALLRRAVNSGTAVELKLCQVFEDFKVKY